MGTKLPTGLSGSSGSSDLQGAHRHRKAIAKIRVYDDDGEFTEEFEEFVYFESDRSIQAFEDLADPNRPLTRTWSFMRALKALDEFKDISADEAHDLVPWKHTVFEENDQVEFLLTWSKVRFAQDQGFIDVAYQRAVENPVIVNSRMRLYGLFLAFCLELQIMKGNDPIFFSRRDLDSRFGCSDKLIDLMRERAEQEGLLTKVRGARMDGGQRRAAEYIVDIVKISARRSK